MLNHATGNCGLSLLFGVVATAALLYSCATGDPVEQRACVGYGDCSDGEVCIDGTCQAEGDLDAASDSTDSFLVVDPLVEVNTGDTAVDSSDEDVDSPVVSDVADTSPSDLLEDSGAETDSENDPDTHHPDVTDLADDGGPFCTLDPLDLCSCTEDDECPTGLCLETEEAGSVCALPCGDCPPGPPEWTCQDAEIEGETVSVCAPYEAVYCTVCTDKTDCPNSGDPCVDLGGASYCFESCSDDQPCPEEYACLEVEEGEFACLPDSRDCPGCVDPDGDDYGVGRDCLGSDCNEWSEISHEDGVEICDGIDNNCDDDIDESCPGGSCRLDFDGDGVICGDPGQCFHNGEIFDSGDFALDCYDDGQRAVCDGGVWVGVSCGDDNLCADSFCADGVCDVDFELSDTLCDGDFACSSAEGDDAYGVGGGLRCRGYCDGAGQCDFAADCETCDDQDGWYGIGDLGPGCAERVDSVGELRDYLCETGACDYSVSETLDCNEQDGLEEGGNQPGCGDDPSALERDYYVASADPSCEYSEDGCDILDCDHLDICEAACEGSQVRSFQDFYADTVTGECQSVFGELLEDCTTSPSVDSDGADDAYTVAGTVTNFSVCESGACTSTVSSDFCTGNTVNEYGADGFDVSGPVAFDCESLESTYCEEARYRYRDEWECSGEPGACAAASSDTYLADCGVDGCAGTCGASLDGCAFHQRTCSEGDCSDVVVSADSGTSFCSACGLSWALGGNVATDACCGDDAGEFQRGCQDSSANGDCGTDVQACCTDPDACVDHTGTCQAQASCSPFGDQGKRSYCAGGLWLDPDNSELACTASGCGFSWLPTAESGVCCGDDGSEHLEASGVGSSCCYAGSVLGHGSSNTDVLCVDGLLYTCGPSERDLGGVADNVAVCGSVEAFHCRSDSTWGATDSNGCQCEDNDSCLSTHCAEDFDGDGKWCAEPLSCVHDGNQSGNGSFSGTCLDASNRALCDAGDWTAASCGSDTSCSDYFCDSGSCDVDHAGTDELCNAAAVCSSTPGNGGYGQAGDYVCQGYCDGSGSCDWAGSCDNCDDQDGYYGGGDNGPGCADMSDPSAELRDYTCSANSCSYPTPNTIDCDSSDGIFGGGDTSGCGDDPSAQQRDYYVGTDGTCNSTSDGCQIFDCDHLDVCSAVCDGSVVKAYEDAHYNTTAESCVTTLGNPIEDCAIRSSVDSDGAADAYSTPGTVTDYTGCSGGACSSSAYADYCAGNTVNEYGANGSDVSGPVEFDCESLETTYCEEARYRYRDEWECSGEPGACVAATTDTYLNDCGVDGCAGTCGASLDGCAFHQRACSEGNCSDVVVSADSGTSFCSACGLGWALGGNVASNTCCGDDDGEFQRGCQDSSANGDCGTDLQACCTDANACVDHTGACQAQASCSPFGSQGKRSYCAAGQWLDPDSSEVACTASGCGFSWLPTAESGVCCGDDGSEHVEASGVGSSCCYAGSALGHGSSSDDVLCVDGLLYTCGPSERDLGGVADNVAVCGSVDAYQCRSDSTWGATDSNGCQCEDDDGCLSTHCAVDFDGDGKWCAEPLSCVHDGDVSGNGSYSGTCLDASNRALCDAGDWAAASCGSDTSCSDYFCDSGTCDVDHAGNTVLCNAAQVCSSAPGNGGYGQAGDYVCQGYCDGSGTCDWAGSCSDCDDQDGYYGGGDDGPGCADMSDPSAELRDYTCSANSCSYPTPNTIDCDSNDGIFGGGNTSGCGNDPSAQQRDYYVDSNGSCNFSTQSCQIFDCDHQDVCSAVCDGSVVKAYRDAYYNATTESCVTTLGSTIEDCVTKSSVDSDGATDAYFTPGTVTDYTGCSGGACASSSYADYCVGSTVYEYGASGAGVVGPSSYSCESLESNYCSSNRYRKRNEWACAGSPGYCLDSTDSTLEDCGVDACEGNCGSSTNGCRYYDRGCTPSACTSSNYDADSDSSYCSGCGLSWAIGGSVDPSECCGDDSSEYRRTCSDSSANGNCGTDTVACCTSSSSCVDQSGTCRSSGLCSTFGTGGKQSYCDSGTWVDPDDSQTACNASGCGYSWLTYGTGTGSDCCGDDPGEDFEQSSGTGRSCCYNGSSLASGSTSGSILCYNGQLHDCENGASDESVATTENSCELIGSHYCYGGSWYTSRPLCDSQYLSSSGSGNNNYGSGSNYRCRGYCDGFGSCDYAGDCCWDDEWDRSSWNDDILDATYISADTGSSATFRDCDDDRRVISGRVSSDGSPDDDDWYWIDVDDCGAGGNPVVDITLSGIPAGHDYDLYVYWGCDSGTATVSCPTGSPTGTQGCYSNGFDTSEHVVLDTECSGTIDEDGIIWIQVRDYSGPTCSTYYSLDIYVW